jgi:mercuric ion binding protein
MRPIFIFTAIILSFVNSFAQKKGIETAQIKTSAVCEMCKETIEKEMSFTKGVTSASLDVKSAILTVSFRSNKTSLEAIRKAINAIGYDADDSPATPEAYEKLHGCCKKDSH